MIGGRLARPLHPGAWWLWATGLAIAASRTTNPVVLVLIVAVSGYVVAARRPASPWSGSYGLFLRIGLFAVAIRVVLFALLGTGVDDGHVLVTLPRVPLPDWMAGVRLGGPVTADGVLAAAYDGLRLAVILVCVGAANALTSPRRLLKSLPAALYETGVAVTVALAFAPQSVAAVGRLRAARRLRGRPDRGVRSLRGLAVPVLEGALDRSIDLAAAMDARGFGRKAAASTAGRRVVAGLSATGLLAMLASSYGLLVPGTPAVVGLPLLLAGAAATAAAFALGARRGGRSRYRPDPWRWPEWLVAASGAVAAVAVVATRLEEIAPPTSPPGLPPAPLLALAGVLVAGLASVLAPPLPRPRIAQRAAREVPRTAGVTT